MTQFADLLRVQEHDTASDQLRHRRAHLPEQAELARVETDLTALERLLVEVTGRRDEVARRQKALEDELANVEAKVAAVNAHMYSGTVTIPRELQAMQAEIDSLKKRCSTLEDDVLEAMTEREPLDEEVASLTAARAEYDATGARLRAAIAEAQATIDAELLREQAARQEAAAALPAQLITLYESLRAELGGIGAARLVGNRCGGCHLTLPATEIDRMRREPPDALIRCDQCSRILVR